MEPTTPRNSYDAIQSYNLLCNAECDWDGGACEVGIMGIPGEELLTVISHVGKDFNDILHKCKK